jgi:hypothetical protein
MLRKQKASVERKGRESDPAEDEARRERLGDLELDDPHRPLIHGGELEPNSTLLCLCRHPSLGSMGVGIVWEVSTDIGEIQSYAEGFARAVVVGDKESIFSYLSEELETSVAGVLDEIPRPLETGQVLRVNPPESGRSISLIDFSGPTGRVMLRAVWQKDRNIPLIRNMHIVERNNPGAEMPRTPS